MQVLNIICNKTWKVKLILFLVSFIIYFFYFHHIFTNLNTLLSSITSDALKNYFTFVYHIKNDASALHFEGMAYPYGEHIVYTDCQPLITFILRLMPITHNYLIGILHFIIFFSFLVSPLILFDVFKLFELDEFSSFFFALGLGLLSPQFLKINAGHFGLAYACIIPLAILLLNKYFKEKNTKVLIQLFIYLVLIFLIHPYMGLSICIFSFFIFLFHFVSTYSGKKHLVIFIKEAGFSLIPIMLFKLFMLLTDHHPNRTDEPYGLNVMVENIDSIVAPVFGPMKKIMEIFFNNRVAHYEGHTYLGLTSIVLSLVFGVVLLFGFRKIIFNKILLAYLFSAFVLLIISFGWHFKLLDYLGIKVAFINQFRATCRFAWFFYYALPIFLIVHLYQLIKYQFSSPFQRICLSLMPFIFITTNLWEANYMFKLDKDVFWKFKNIFYLPLLNAEEIKNIKLIQKNNVQAIVPLPLFYSGSEMYDRTGFNNSMLPAMLYASHTGKPILGALMSRTSISETEETINLLNNYKINRPALSKITEGNFLLIKTEKEILPDEERLFNSSKVFHQNDSLTFSIINKKDFLKKKFDKNILHYPYKNILNPDTNEIVFISKNKQPVFNGANMKDMTSIYSLDSNKINGGKYIVSFKFNYTLKNYHALACDLIITESEQNNLIWKYMIPLRIMSGFYKGFGVFESNIYLQKNKKYEFLISGREDQPYTISDFMLRPSDKSLIMAINHADTSYNNFPQN
jgi:hypothetical protein